MKYIISFIRFIIDLTMTLITGWEIDQYGNKFKYDKNNNKIWKDDLDEKKEKVR